MAKKVYCNKCGKEMDFWDRQEEISIHTKLELDLCCDCMEELVNSCKISPVIDNT